MNVAVVGLGKIGLPLAVQYASKGAQVLGCDLDFGVVSAVNRGVSPVLGEPGLDEMLASAVAAGNLAATTATSAAVAASEVVIVVVPVGVDADHVPDFRHLDSAADAIRRALRPGTLVVLETTVPVGVTRNRFGRRLHEALGHVSGDFHLAYSPERVSSGSIFSDLATYPKLVGGLDAASAEAAAAFYRSMLDAEVVVLPDMETAEFAKLAESVYRDVNIALANELAIAAETFGVDYAATAAAANTQPFSHLHVPGVGVGGHCIPVYPYFLTSAVQQPIVAAGRRRNDAMADHAVARLDQALHDAGSRLRDHTVLILGLSYRGGVKEATLSSTHLLAVALRKRGASVLVHDPMFTPAEIAAYGLEPSTLPPAEPVEAVILQAGHRAYRDFDFKTLQGCRVLLDGRRALDRATIEAAGMRYVAIGLPRAVRTD